MINQEEIDERQVVRFDEELAQENEEDARRKKEASKRMRRVSFVLEAEEETSGGSEGEGEDDSDDTVKGEENVQQPDALDNSDDDRDHRYHDIGAHDGGDLVSQTRRRLFGRCWRP